MTPWGLGYVVTNAIYWALFLGWKAKYRPPSNALLVGILHVFFAGLVEYPLRPLLEPRYPGWGIGFLHFEGREAVLPTLLILGWALASAFLAVAVGRGRWMLLIGIGDAIWVVNVFAFQAMNLLAGRRQYDFRMETVKITGPAAVVIVELLFVSAFIYSARWAFRRSSQPRSTAPELHP
ncbi:MAG: hypothetical protein L0099_08885 [Acidobacteria bacterium]|nr:hypothetical protein [Acidobacteriota bacterium]